MGNCCKERRAIIGTYKGIDGKNQLESAEEGGLRKLLEDIFVKGRRLVELQRCRRCGQLWTWHEEGSGHGEHSVYAKITADTAKQQFPGINLP